MASQKFAVDQEELKLLLECFVESLKPLKPQSYNGFMVLPVTSELAKENRYLLLEEALDTGKFRIEEISEGGSVPELKVINELDREVLLLEGDILVGAKQNRTLNTTIIVGKRKELVIPVSCVEQGRWSYRSSDFKASNYHLDMDLRKEKVKDLIRSLKREGKYRSDQEKIWRMIKKKMSICYCMSPTEDLTELYNQELKKQDKKVLEVIKPVEGQIGAIIFVHNVPFALEVFGIKGVWEKKFEKLIMSYYFEVDKTSISGLPGKRDEKIEPEKLFPSLIKQIKESKKEIFKSPGEGYDLRFEEEHMTGFAIEHDGKIVHLVNFYTI